MFSLFNGIYDSYLAPSQMNLLIVGAPNVGKTTLLERLKVTEIPTRVKSRGGGTTKGVADRLDAEPLTLTLYETFIETGAQKVPQLLARPSTIIIKDKAHGTVGKTSGNRQANPLSEQSQLSSITKPSFQVPPAKSAPSSSAVKATQKRRFHICPAPERYLKSRDDDDDDQDEVIRVVDSGTKHAEEEHLLQPLSSGQTTQQQHSQDDTRNGSLNSSHHSASDPPRRVRCHSKEFNVDSLDLMDGRRSSLEDIPIDRNGSSSSVPPPPAAQQQQQGMGENKNEQNSDGGGIVDTTSRRLSQHYPQPVSPGEPLLQNSPEEYQLKPNAKMLPLKMIRPTSKCSCVIFMSDFTDSMNRCRSYVVRSYNEDQLMLYGKIIPPTVRTLKLNPFIRFDDLVAKHTVGTNLGKLDMYGVKCHIFDVGGRLQDLWERYYDDCDAVVFCWKMGEDPDKPVTSKDGHDSDDDEEDNDPVAIYKQQQEMLSRVRKSIPDDVPFLIFGHIFGNANVDVVDRMYSTDLLLPHYHNPMTGLCCGSAKNGAGVQAAMDWLIPLAKRQQKERLAVRRQVEEKEI